MAEFMENIMAAPAAWIILQSTRRVKLVDMPQAKELKEKRAIPRKKSLALPTYSATYRPSNILLTAVFGTQIVATIIAVYGLLIPPIGWSLALFVWAYAMVAFVLTDLAKVFLFKRFEREMNILEKDAIAVETEVKNY